MEISGKEKSQTSGKNRILLKVMITFARLSLFFVDIWLKSFTISTSIMSILVLGGLFILIQAYIFYRLFRKDHLPQWSIFTTMSAHSYALVNVLLISITSPLAQQAPVHDNYFCCCIGQMVNYLLTVIGLYAILGDPLLKDSKQFFLIYQPIGNSLFYLFGGVYVGTLLDMLAFQGRALWACYMLTSLLFLYILTEIVFGSSIRRLRKFLFVE